MANKVSRNIVWLVVSRVLAAVLVFVGYASLFRYLGTYKAGQYQFVLSYVMLFSVVVDFGISQLVIKKVSENKEDAKKYLGHFFAVEVILAFLILSLLTAIAYFAGYDSLIFKAIFVAGFGMFLNALTIPHKSILSAFQDMHHIAILNFLDSVVNVLVIFAAIFFNKGIVFLAGVQFWNAVVHIIGYEYLIHRYVQKPQLFRFLKQLDFALIKKMLIAALPFGMLVGFSIVYNRIDVIILAHFRGYAETGLYTAAYKFVDLLAFVPAVVSSSLYPFFADRLKADDKEAVRGSLQAYSRYMLALAVPLAFGGFVLARKLIVVVGGQEFSAGDQALQILVFASAITFIYAAVNSIMISHLTRLALKITFVNIFLNIVGNFLLIPILGFKAAAIITVLSELFQASAYFYFVRSRITHFNFFRYTLQPIIAALIMALVLWPLRNGNVLLSIPLGAAIYILLLLISGFFKQSDVLAVKRIFKPGT